MHNRRVSGTLCLFTSKLASSIRQAQGKRFHAFEKLVRIWIFDRGGVSLTSMLSDPGQKASLDWIRPYIRRPCNHCKSIISTRYCNGLTNMLLIWKKAIIDFSSVYSRRLILTVMALTGSDRRHKERNSLKGEELAILAGRKKVLFLLESRVCLMCK